MKYYFLRIWMVLLCGTSVFLASGQSTAQSLSQQGADFKPDPGKNLVKFNTLTLLGGKFSFEYERLLTERLTVGAAVSFRPEKPLPFREKVSDWVDSEELDVVLDGLTSSNFSVTPELRFYTSTRGPFRGFYLAPYLKYATYDAAMPFEFDVEVEQNGQMIYDRTETIPLTGSVTSWTGGLSIGFNFKLTDRVHLDWRMIGPGYGTAKGEVLGTMNLTPDEQAALREGLDQLQLELEELPVPLKTSYEVNGNGANIQVLKSPWAGIRTGLSVSYRF